MSQASFSLRGRNPDVLSCIANLSNDEVFTPPEFAGRMLDTLADAWAADNDGASVWANPEVTFLDPCAKSGVFLREITKRLIEGLEAQIPDLQTRVDHILTKQVFGIGITELTSMLARRSLYCSKHANGPHSITHGFASEAGNVWFERMEHTWGDKKCRFCGAPKTIFERGDELESHAYGFIHTDNIRARLAELFGEEMQFDVIIGNPPYQMKGGGGGSNDSSIYHLFVEQAMKLEPRYLSMVIPSRWLAGGRGMDAFRKSMLNDKKISHFVDYTKMSTAFPGVDFEGGVGYFLWGKDHVGSTEYTLITGDEEYATTSRDLGQFDVFVRDQRALEILEKVQDSDTPNMQQLISGDTPFGLATNFKDFKSKPFEGSVPVFRTAGGKRVVSFSARETIRKNTHLIDCWKVLLPEAYGERGAIPALVLGPSIVAPPASVCTQTYLVAGPMLTEEEALSLQSYINTRFFRFFVSLRKITQHALRSTYSWVPQQTWDQKWTDEKLNEKYGITVDQAEYIVSMIRPVTNPDD